MRMQSKRAIVTGGGRGIGLGIVECFLEEGAKVCILQRTAPDSGLENHRLHYVQTDLADTVAIAKAASSCIETMGGVDILVNNAGIMLEQSLDDLEIGSWDQLMAVNLRAPAFLAQAVLPALTESRGTIINIGSIEGNASNPLHAAYCASKAGLHGLTRALAVDLGPRGISCNAIAPGWIQSDMSEDYINAQASPEQLREELKRMHPAGRLGTPRDIGEIAVGLATDTNDFLTGQVIVVDGGRTTKLPLPF